MSSIPLVCALSLDGGGMAGIIMLYVLDYLEQKTGKPIAHLFHLVSGVSTGGLIALGLNKPQERCPLPAYSAHEILTFYRSHAPQIFQKTFIGKVSQFFPFTSSLYHLFFSQYSPEGAKEVFSYFLGKTLLSQSITNIIIPSYNLESFKGKGARLKLFSSSKIQRLQKKNLGLLHSDFAMWEIALATSAAPTYFPPHRIHRVRHNESVPTSYCLIDGGVAMNDPSLLSYVEMGSLFQKKRFAILSLGLSFHHHSYESIRNQKSPGQIYWAKHLGHLITGPQSSAYQAILRSSRQQNPYFVAYVRIQPSSHVHLSSFDDHTPSYMARLEKIALEIIKKRENDLKKFLTLLSEAHS